MDYKVSKFLIENDSKYFNKILEGPPIYSPISKSIVKAWNINLIQRDCKNLEYFSSLLLNLNPRSAYAYLMSASCKEQVGDFNGGVADLRIALKLEKDNPDYLIGLAILYYKMGEYDLSKKLLNQSKSINSSSPQIQQLELLLKNTSSN
jgi:tetratricopeptide (TPR) repeat protein